MDAHSRFHREMMDLLKEQRKNRILGTMARAVGGGMAFGGLIVICKVPMLPYSSFFLNAAVVGMPFAGALLWMNASAIEYNHDLEERILSMRQRLVHMDRASVRAEDVKLV
jgi:hypothetical protein